MSLPVSNPVSPAASATADPPDDPPGTRVTSHGLLVVPWIGLKVCQSAASRGRFVLPNNTAPACRYRSTASALRAGILSRSSGRPQVVGSPSTSKDSLIVIGTPCSGPQTSPFA